MGPQSSNTEERKWSIVQYLVYYKMLSCKAMLILALTILTFSATPTKWVVDAAIQSITPSNEFVRPNGIANNEAEEKDGLASSYEKLTSLTARGLRGFAETRASRISTCSCKTFG